MQESFKKEEIMYQLHRVTTMYKGKSPNVMQGFKIVQPINPLAEGDSHRVRQIITTPTWLYLLILSMAIFMLFGCSVGNAAQPPTITERGCEVTNTASLGDCYIQDEIRVCKTVKGL